MGFNPGTPWGNSANHHTTVQPHNPNHKTTFSPIKIPHEGPTIVCPQNTLDPTSIAGSSFLDLRNIKKQVLYMHTDICTLQITFLQCSVCMLVQWILVVLNKVLNIFSKSLNLDAHCTASRPSDSLLLCLYKSLSHRGLDMCISRSFWMNHPKQYPYTSSCYNTQTTTHVLHKGNIRKTDRSRGMVS